jgi:hypothetical protein
MNEIEKAKAIKVLEQSAAQLDAMNARSRESGKSFAELRPL